MTTAYVPQTTVDTMARIAAGVDPWIAYRDFLEDWTYLPESRADLMAGEPGFADEEQRRWVALLAASIDALCARDGLIAPKWTDHRDYRLAEPWFLYEGHRTDARVAARVDSASLRFAEYLERRPDPASNLASTPRRCPR